jgi:hypothetical protein
MVSGFRLERHACIQLGLALGPVSVSVPSDACSEAAGAESNRRPAGRRPAWHEIPLAPAVLCWYSGCLFEELKFNKHCSTFVLFDKKFLILN